jgi:RNA polymerase sigma-70 factor (ECF subfamily)
MLEAEIPHLRRFARYLTRDPDYADDLVQDCIVRALRGIDSWTPGTKLRAWLFVILKNKFKNDLRQKHRQHAGSVELEFRTSGDQFQETRARDMMMDVQRAFTGLSDEHREILLLVAVEGLEYEEAATVLGIAVGTVRSRLARARRHLRELVGELHTGRDQASEQREDDRSTA